MNYVNQEAFFDWYSSTSKQERFDKSALLSEVFEQYCRTHNEEYVLPAECTRSGKEERYPFRFENIGCCGASTMFLYF